MSNIRWYDLSHDFEPNMPVPDWPGEKRQEFELISYRVSVNSGTQNNLSMNLHCGTHVDAPSHYVHGGKSIDEVAFDYLMGETIVIDVEKQELQSVTLSDILPFEKKMEGKKMVFLRTGWETKWKTKDYESKYPYLAPEVGEYFARKRIHAIGIDTPGPDAPIRSGQRKGDPLHINLLSNEVLIIENLTNLKNVIGRDLYVYAFPLKIRGATGSPLRVLARDDRV
ncbi:MAG: cyclase family protein [Conexivisphaerales archaeon]